jgi:hypothetical protein
MGASTGDATDSEISLCEREQGDHDDEGGLDAALVGHRRSPVFDAMTAG